MIYTSNYYSPHYPLNHKLVSISRSLTDRARMVVCNHKGIHYLPLAPEWQWVEDIKKGTITQEEYTELYNERLSRLDADWVITELGDDIVLLCYEPFDQFCHRHLVAQWLRDNQYHVEELDPNSVIKKVVSSAFQF